MANFDDFEKADLVIKEFFRKRDEFIKASPYIEDIRATIDWYKKVYTEIPGSKEAILNAVDSPLKAVLGFNLNDFTLSSATGATGSFYETSGTTRSIIQSYGVQYNYLIDEYYEISETENIIDRLSNTIAEIDQDLSLSLQTAKTTYLEWKTGAKSDSDLCKDIRSFQDFFKGFLNKVRLKAILENRKKAPKFSWPKMVEPIAKKGGGSLKTLKNQQGVHEKSHSDFTKIMKGTKIVEREEMSKIFKDYIEHLFTIVESVDWTLFKK
jgi:hypothetical protein